MKTFQCVFTCVMSALAVTLAGCSDKSIAHWEHAKQGVYSAAISPDAKYALVGTIHQGPLLWDLEQQSIKYAWFDEKSDNNEIVAVAFSQEGNFVAAAEAFAVSVFEVATGASMGYWKIDGRITALDLSKGGRYALIGLTDGRILYIDLGHGQQLGTLRHAEYIESVDFAPDGLTAVSGSRDDSAILWNLETGRVLTRWEHHNDVKQVMFSPSGRWVFTAEAMGGVSVWEAQTGQKVQRLGNTLTQGLTASALALSGDESKLILGSPAGTVSLWNLSDAQEIKQWRLKRRSFWKPSGAIPYALSFSEDMQYAYVESSNGFAEQLKID